MKILRNFFSKDKPPQHPTIAEKDKPSSSKPRNLTKIREREFFKLIINEDEDCSNAIHEMLQEFPQLAHSIVSGMKKGIDGFSSLMLTIRFYQFDASKVLVQNGANVNFIDSSDVRQQHYPIFFDFIEAMRDLIEAEAYDEVENGFKLWDLFDENGLDYSLRSVITDGINRSQNYVEAFIRLTGVKYGNKHLVHSEIQKMRPNTYNHLFRVSNESRNLKKESFYTRMAERLMKKVTIGQLKEVDANRHRSWSSVILPFYIESGFIDDFSLSLLNDLTKKTHGFELKNINDLKFLQTNIDQRITRIGQKPKH